MTGTITTSKSRLGSNGNEEVHHSPLMFRSEFSPLNVF